MSTLLPCSLVQAKATRSPEGEIAGASLSPALLTSGVRLGGVVLTAGRNAKKRPAAAAKPAGEPPRFALPAILDVTLKTESQVIESRNVLGLIEGSDPSLRDQVVVLSAHLDHIGVTAAVDGDSINNGALDNAAGVATTLEAARAFQHGR